MNEFASLPGIGRKTAVRLVLNLLKRDQRDVEAFSSAIYKLRTEVRYCSNCHNISDAAICNICTDNSRDKSVVCVVEDVRDVMAIENTGQYRGIYHVLGGRISPMEGVGPSELNVDSLVQKANEGNLREIIMAMSTTMEGDTTSFYLYRKLSTTEILISSIARGISFGDELEYADEVTLGRSIINRTRYTVTVNG